MVQCNFLNQNNKRCQNDTYEDNNFCTKHINTLQARKQIKNTTEIEVQTHFEEPATKTSTTPTTNTITTSSSENYRVESVKNRSFLLKDEKVIGIVTPLTLRDIEILKEKNIPIDRYVLACLIKADVVTETEDEDEDYFLS